MGFPTFFLGPAHYTVKNIPPSPDQFSVQQVPKPASSNVIVPKEKPFHDLPSRFDLVITAPSDPTVISSFVFVIILL